jgi:hypothetical protein
MMIHAEAVLASRLLSSSVEEQDVTKQNFVDRNPWLRSRDAEHAFGKENSPVLTGDKPQIQN